MSVWKQIPGKPGGVMPGGIVTKIGVAVTAFLLAAMLLTYGLTGGGEDPAATVEVPEAAGLDLQQRAQAAIAAEARRQADVVERAAEAGARRLEQLQAAEEAAGGLRVAGLATGSGQFTGDPTAETEAPRTEAEAVLLETLRLEDMERRRRSLRAEPLVLSYRDAGAPGGGQPPTGPVNAPLPGGLPGLAQTAGTAVNAGSLEDSIASAGDFLSLLAELDAQEAARNGTTAQEAPAVAGTVPGPLSRAPEIPVVERPEDPAGWDRIHEGSFLEAVLVTQLNGDFPGPVLANVSVPFYSANRQRVLVPRGARVVGTVQAVAGQDQERLAVAFHRLLWPDGRSVSLSFNGLNQLGESALKDEVDRHYFSMFAAAGAVGILSGLTARGSDPYAGGRAGFQAGASQGLGQSAIQILDRFLNRLPTITIRAGHRLRIWFTGDVRVPPAPAGRIQ